MRKFYNLAFVRLEHLCHGCNITEESFKRKIWTTFETAIREHTDLFKGRHLDQNIMCSLYICWKKENHKKGVKDEKIFSKIIQQVIIYLFKSVKIFSSVDPVTIAFLTEIFLAAGRVRRRSPRSQYYSPCSWGSYVVYPISTLLSITSLLSISIAQH